MESPANAALVQPRGHTPRQGSLDLIPASRRWSEHPRWPQGLLTGLGLGAAAAGLIGVEGGLLWIVIGVWTVRAVWGRGPGLALGVACVAAGLRWSAFGLLDVEAATRTLGPTVVAGPRLVAVGAGAALAGAVLEESAANGMRAMALPERAAAGGALIALVAAYLAPGPGSPGLAISIAWWLVASGGLTAVVILASSVAARVPPWASTGISLAGAGAIAMARPW